MAAVEDPLTAAPEDQRPGKAMTIGAVSKALRQEFPDISISKIRYLEDQKLLEPRRTPGGYRLYAQSDVARLRTILRMQRDEFLPLRVIRQELASGRVDGDEPTVPSPAEDANRPRRRPSVSVTGGTKYYDETEREIIRAVTELARYGVGGRNLRAFRTSADREAALLQQILAPALRSRNVERRKEAVEALENLAAVTTHLKHLLLIRDLRKIVG
jgi:DNA-binding transcriptional MerR regulator